jgi:hypothetical protein
MYSIIAFWGLVLALSSKGFSIPLHRVRQDGLTYADTVQFVAKTILRNPNPNVNNWLFVTVPNGNGTNLATLVDPSKYTFNLSQPGFFQNGIDYVHSAYGGHLTAGFLSGTTPWSLVLDLAHQSGSRNPMAESGTLQFNTGVRTEGLTVTSGQLLTSNFQSDFFWAYPNVPVQGGVAMAVEVTNRFATYSPQGC